MEKFRKKVQTWQRAMIIGLIALIALYALLILFVPEEFSYSGGRQESFMGGFRTGIFVGIALILVMRIYTFTQALRDDTKLRELQIKRTDEREVLINYKIGQLSFVAFSVILGIALIVTSFLNQTAFNTLIVVMAVYALVKLIAIAYVRRTN